MIRLKVPFLFCLAVVTLTGCGGRPTDRPTLSSVGPDIVAIYDGGVVTTGEIDRAILGLPEDERPSGSELTAERYRELIRYLVAERLLTESAAAQDFKLDPDSAEALEATNRQILVRAYVQRHLPPIAPPTETELKAEYESTIDLYRRDAKRLVTHLFKRRETGEAADTSRSEIEALRARAIAGENLSTMAREHSDSESRHHDGNIGWIEHGQLPPQLEDIIFGLEEGELSQPIVTREGVHLFQVENIVEKKEFEFEAVRDTVARRWIEARSREATERMADELPPVDGLWMAGPEDVMPLIEHGDPQAAVLRTDDHVITVARFSQLLAQAGQNAGRVEDPVEAVADLLDDLGRFETIYAAAQTAGLANDEIVAAQLEKAEESAIINSARRAALDTLLASQPELTRKYFRQNELRFSSPLELRLRRMRVPIEDGEANHAMAELERETARIGGSTGAGGSGIDTLADRFGVTVEELGWRTIAAIAKANPAAATTVVNLEPGSLSPPYQQGGFLEVLEVVERREPQPRPLATVLDAVHTAYLADHGTELFRLWMEQRLDEVNLEIIDARIADDRSDSGGAVDD